MPKAPELKVLDIDGQKSLVEEMSPEVQALVATYNEWTQDMVDARTKATQLQAAVQFAHNQISAQIKKEFDEAQAAEQAKHEAEAAPALDAKAEAEALVAQERLREAQAAEAAEELSDAGIGDRLGAGEQRTEED